MAALKTRVVPRDVSSARILGIAVVTGLVVFVAAGQIERVVISWMGVGGHRLEWISDVLAAAAITTVTYLWLHLRASRTQLLQLERAQIALDEQLRLAAEIQQSLLPAHPPTTPGIEWAARMEAALRVGGDFYDYAERDDGLVLVLGDVSGKGLGAALMQSALQTLFRTHAALGRDPAAIASHMSEGLRRQTGGVPYATAIVAHVDPRHGRLTYVNAGHPPGVVVHAREVIPMSAGGPPLALLDQAEYELGAVDLHRGDLVALVTDGVTEPLDSQWIDILQGLSTTQSAAEITRALLNAARTATGPAEAGTSWQDDRTVVAFRIQDR